MISFGAVVAANNLLALKDFNTFLFTLEIHERPGFLERKLISWAKGWIAKKAVDQLTDLKAEIDPSTFGLGIKDCPTSLYSAFFTATQPQVLKTGAEIFAFLSMSQLEFEKIKKGIPNESFNTESKG